MQAAMRAIKRTTLHANMAAAASSFRGGNMRRAIFQTTSLACFEDNQA